MHNHHLIPQKELHPGRLDLNFTPHEQIAKLLDEAIDSRNYGIIDTNTEKSLHSLIISTISNWHNSLPLDHTIYSTLSNTRLHEIEFQLTSAIFDSRSDIPIQIIINILKDLKYPSIKLLINHYKHSQLLINIIDNLVSTRALHYQTIASKWNILHLIRDIISSTSIFNIDTLHSLLSYTHSNYSKPDSLNFLSSIKSNPHFSQEQITTLQTLLILDI